MFDNLAKDYEMRFLLKGLGTLALIGITSAGILGIKVHKINSET